MFRSAHLFLFFCGAFIATEAVSDITNGRAPNGQIICDLTKYPNYDEMEALAGIAKSEIDISTDRGCLVSNITIKVWENWGWFDDYEDARRNYISSTGNIIDYLEVDRAIMAVAAYACTKVW